MNHNLDEMALPQSSRNQELEVISQRIFEPLFDVERFVLDGKVIDNGIDYHCELKYKGNVTGFGFNFQLKSKEKNEPLKNGTYSKSFELLNIQYLINNTHPAFYGFYIVESDTFYYEYLNDFIANLKTNNTNWEKQQNHTLNFYKKLDKQAVDKIYDVVLARGMLFRKINSSLVDRLAHSHLSSNIIIDFNDNVTSEIEIIKIVEKYGFELINQSNWNKVIELHSKTLHSSTFSAKYNMIVGLAYYYKSDYLTSLKYLKNAIREKANLVIELQNHLIFIISSIKLLLLMITKEEYDSTISNLEPDKHITFHVKIDSAIEIAKEKLFQTENLRVEEFEDCINSIISNIEASLQVKLRAKSELLIYEGNIAIQQYSKHICRINAFEVSLFVNYEYRKKINDELQLLFTNIEQEYFGLFEEIKTTNNYFAFYYLLMHKQKYDFLKYSTFEILKLAKESIIIDYSDNYEKILINLDSCFDYFNKIGHIENQIFAKSIKYEILHYLKRYELAKTLIAELEDTVVLIDIKSLKEQLEFIKNGGTNHQMLQELLDDKINNPKEKIEQLRNELIKLDEIEKNINVNKVDHYQVTLFPIGNFIVPKNNLEKFYKIFEIKKGKLKEQFKYMFELGVVPVVNTYVYPIRQEGPLEGNLEYKGFESFLNMYNARKKFFENKFYRLNNK
ncbi:DUF4365 domain-containing protein [Flavobacterium jejuense]|jgi:hypothetical protein|uniref:DUF4365 domain-containing protein n=1 Tax=Flavobacterium jejuense TaxID=1544455 RepID=A0ABX0IWX2_9FLAO|nr:DUF4365 domain-containing protein [Flavobacterium jejuense]NHN27267.1 DUF4365 domain-containing protein [Flavobacterium jejuense]